MAQTLSTDNYRKHTHRNPIEKGLLKVFYWLLFAELKKLRPKKILDVGAGEGFVLFKLKQQRIGKEVEGIEYSKTAIKIGKKLHPTVQIHEGTIYNLPYKDNEFDTVLCSEVLEHLEDPEAAIKELVRVSSKFVVLTVPNEPFWMAANFLRGKNWSRFGNDIEHINHWTFWGFRKFVSKHLAIKTQKMSTFWTLIIARKVKN